jgi:hypothetical protein
VTYRLVDIAEAQAVGLCWLARQGAERNGQGGQTHPIPGKSGLPPFHTLRMAAAQLHETECDWCAYPLDELMRMLEARDISERAEEVWWGLPSRARGRAIELAQGRE